VTPLKEKKKKTKRANRKNSKKSESEAESEEEESETEGEASSDEPVKKSKKEITENWLLNQFLRLLPHRSQKDQVNLSEPII